MNQKTNDFLRDVLSTRIKNLLTHTASPNQAVIDELEATSSALIDIMRGPSSADSTAAVALSALVQGVSRLVELNRYFENGAGKDSSTHKFIQQLLMIAEDQIPTLPDA